MRATTHPSTTMTLAYRCTSVLVRLAALVLLGATVSGALGR